MKEIKSKTKDDFKVYINDKLDVNNISFEILDGLVGVIYKNLKEILKKDWSTFFCTFDKNF